MKKILLILAVFFGIGKAYADNKLVVGETTIPQGLTGTIDIELQNDVAFTAFTLKLTLPEGLSFVEKSGKATFEESGRFDGHSLSASAVTNNSAIFACLSTNNDVIKGTNGTLISVYVKADANLAEGTKLAATLTEATFATPSEEEYHPSDVNISITVGEPRIILNENSVVTIPEEEGVDVQLNRTLKGGNWSTIILPFTASGAQVKTAFGNDVQLAEFTGWNSEKEGDAVVAISVSFESVDAADGIEANTPMLIKTTADISKANFDGVDLEPEDNPNVKTGTSSTRAYFYGTYPSTIVPEEHVFISNNKFWYSTGNTTIKGYRGYFKFKEVLASYPSQAGVKINIFVDDEATRISDLSSDEKEEGAIYDLSGRKLNNVPQKGIYIVNGKKVMK